MNGPAEGAVGGVAGGALHDALETGLRRVASTDRLLVVSDFDGTLAPIVDHPDAVAPDRGAVNALRALAKLPDTRVAVLSGRARAVLVEHLGRSDMTLVGSHGAELDPELEAGSPPARSDGAAPDESAAARRALEDAVEALDTLAAEYEGALVERKPTAVAFHYRQVDPERQGEAAERAAAFADAIERLRIQPGHKVVELVIGDMNKGSALDTLRGATDATATIFVGDDRTDEHAFARLGPSDLAVKIGPGSTCAPVRIASQAEVAPLFRRLHSLRAARHPIS